MAFRTLCHQDDLIIDRSNNEVSLYNGDGELLVTFVKPITDESIREVLAFANSVYQQGQKMGEFNKQYEIKKALGLP